jgi:hypothetical protein
MKMVSGVYQEESALVDAVKELQSRGIPSDAISVLVRDPDTEKRKEVPIDLESGVEEGAVLGGSLGAALGAAGVTLATTGVIALPGVGLLAAGPILAAIQGALAGGAVGAPIGGLLGMGKWSASPHLDTEALKDGAAIVLVESDELWEAAKGVFEETGALRVRVSDQED